jgi:hypothetical protein
VGGREVGDVGDVGDVGEVIRVVSVLKFPNSYTSDPASSLSRSRVCRRPSPELTSANERSLHLED